MKIQAINNQMFGNKNSYKICKENPEKFYTLTEFGKLDVLYDMLNEQKQDLITLSKNQYKIQHCNDNASMAIIQSFNHGMNGKKAASLGNCFDSNRINVIG